MSLNANDTSATSSRAADCHALIPVVRGKGARGLRQFARAARLTVRLINNPMTMPNPAAITRSDEQRALQLIEKVLLVRRQRAAALRAQQQVSAPWHRSLRWAKRWLVRCRSTTCPRVVAFVVDDVARSHRPATAADGRVPARARTRLRQHRLRRRSKCRSLDSKSARSSAGRSAPVYRGARCTAELIARRRTSRALPPASALINGDEDEGDGEADPETIHNE